MKPIRKFQHNCRFFSKMSEEEISDFLGMGKQATYGPGNVIFKEGVIAGHFYLMVSGKVVVRIVGKEVRGSMLAKCLMSWRFWRKLPGRRSPRFPTKVNRKMPGPVVSVFNLE